jgi:ubiquinone/menaquinone biosynthesis C-methylase UbiE
MGWYDCYDFAKREYTQLETKAKEIWRVLKAGGRFVVCSWEKQEGVSWMEEAIHRHYPAILEDQEYLERRPIGMAYEKAEGYETILRDAGFRDIKIIKEEAVFISTDEEEWWRQMMHLGWDSLIDNIKQKGIEQVQSIKKAIFEELQQYKQSDGIQFAKTVFFICGMK